MLQFRWSRVTAVGIFLLALFFVLLDAATGDAATTTTTTNNNKKKDVKIRNKREGSWSGWSVWSPCSRSCGGGIRTQTRQCQIRRGGRGVKSKADIVEEFKLWKNVSSRHCEGHSTRHHLCNIQKCPNGSIDFRESQCKAFDNRPFMGKVYQWEAFIDERSPCSLTCRAKGFRFFATLNKSVVDGTDCKSSPFDLQVCITGTCTPIGCDGIAGSSRRMDRCGICGGDNSTCRVVSGIFTRPQLPVGYNMVAHIPVGACNLNITQIRKSPNYLALRTNDGSYILNGNWAISWPGEYEGAGAKFLYTRQDLKSYESIAASGPLREPIDLLVLYQQPNPGIKYEYMLPMNDAPIPPVPIVDPIVVGPTRHRHSPPSSSLSLTPRPSSILSLNNNNQNNLVPPSNLLLTNSNNGNNPNIISSFIPKQPSSSSSSSSASSSNPANLIYLPGDSSSVYNVPGSSSKGQEPQHPHLHHHHGRRRNHNSRASSSSHQGGKHGGVDGEKKFYWKITGYSNCSEPCGGGTQRAIVRCVRGPNGNPVSDRRCHMDEKPLGQTIRCNLKPCPAEWISGPWSACSETCGPDGWQSRQVHCQQRVSPTLTMRVAEGACLEKQPESRKSCFIKPCHRWETTAWSQCSAQCGNGIRSRKVTCVNSNGEIMENDCDPGEPKPLEISACNMGPCEFTDWFVSDWSKECSQTCGSGLQSRHVICGLHHRRRHQQHQTSSSSETETNLVEDEEGNGGQVGGRGNDDEDEQDENSELACDDSKKPSEERECFTERLCGEPAWFSGPWGECSVTCGGQGLKSRQILCVLFNRGKFKVVDESLCSVRSKPDEKISCENHPTSCPPRWFTTEWSECSAPCGGGTQRRSVSCRGSNWTMSSSNCLDGERPLSRRSCNEHKCLTTTTTTATLTASGNTDPSGMVKDTPPLTLPPVDTSAVRSSSSSSVHRGTPVNDESHHHQQHQHHRPQAAAQTQSQTQSRTQSSENHHNEPNEEPDDTECTDQYRNCPLVVQARLCRYKYYRSVCCSACAEN